MLYNEKNPHGGDIYGGKILLDYSANTNPYGTPEAVKQAIRDSLSSIDRYPDPYCRRLKAAIAEFEQVPESCILCGNGAADLIYAWCQAVQPQRAMELAPTFSEYGLALGKCGCHTEQFVLREVTDFALTEAILPVLREKKPQALFLCNPNNPTGKLADFSVLEKICRFCQEKDIWLFADECFLDLSDGGVSLKGYLSSCPKLIILKAFTKSYGMAGVRLGYCLSGNPDLLHKMAEVSQPWNVSTLAQAAGVAALGQQDFLNRTKETVRVERAWLKAQLEVLGLRVYDSQVNFLLFHGPEDLKERLLEQGISIRSCDNFRGLGPGWYRIAVRLRQENQILADAIYRIMERK